MELAAQELGGGTRPQASSQAGSGELARHVRDWTPEARDDDQRLEVLSF